MPTLINGRSIAVSLIIVGTLLLTTCLAYVIYQAVTVAKLSDLEQSVHLTATPSSQQTNNPRFTQDGIAIPVSPSHDTLYPADVLLPFDWGNPYWGEDRIPVPFSSLYKEYLPINRDYLPSGQILPRAIRMRIPSIQVDASIEELELVNLGAARSYETPNKIIGHIPETSHPGGIGNGWYFAHLESALNREGAIFKDLPLIPGKIQREEPVFIIVDSKDTSYLYRVTKTFVKPKEELLVTESSSPVITLVTCVPRLVYDHRLLISAELVGSKSRNS